MAQFIPGGLLISRPVHGRGLSTRVTGPGKEYPVFSNKVRISLGVRHGVAVFHLNSSPSVKEAGTIVIHKLPAVSLKAVNSHMKQILPFSKPPFTCRRICKIRYHGTAEPTPFRYHVRGTIGIGNNKALLNRFRAVRLVFRANAPRLQFFQNRNLPEDQADPLFVKTSDHPFRIGETFFVKAVKGGFIAPGFDYHHRGFHPLPDRFLHYFFHHSLTIPAVGRHPKAKSPVRRQFRPSRELCKLIEYLQRLSRKCPYIVLIRKRENDPVSGFFR